jgi:hypothetical protein
MPLEDGQTDELVKTSTNSNSRRAPRLNKFLKKKSSTSTEGKDSLSEADDAPGRVRESSRRRRRGSDDEDGERDGAPGGDVEIPLVRKEGSKKQLQQEDRETARPKVSIYTPTMPGLCRLGI